MRTIWRTMKSKRLKYIAGLAALLLAICLFRSCCDALFVASREVFVSPQGTNTIIIEYDHVCRPYVYQKTWYGKREIWTYCNAALYSRRKKHFIFDSINTITAPSFR